MKWWAVLAAGRRTDRVRKHYRLCSFSFFSFSAVDFAPKLSLSHTHTHANRKHIHTIDFPPLSVLVLIWMMCLMWSTLRRIIDVSANTTWLPCEWLHLIALLKKTCMGTGSWNFRRSNNHTPKLDEWGFIWNKQSFWPANWCTILCDWSNRVSFICTPAWQTKHIRAIKVL